MSDQFDDLYDSATLHLGQATDVLNLAISAIDGSGDDDRKRRGITALYLVRKELERCSVKLNQLVDSIPFQPANEPREHNTEEAS